jgi:uncharacterized protein (TIGR03435 family)
LTRRTAELAILASLAAASCLATGEGCSENGAAFEVASVKPLGTEAPMGVGRLLRLQLRPNLLEAKQATLKALIGEAYHIDQLQIVDGPNWLDRDRFNVTGKCGRQATREEFRAALRNLLAERFALTTHRETRVVPIYRMVVAKDGPKFQPAQDEGPSSPAAFGHLRFRDLPSLCAVLSTFSDRVVVDETGLQGRYGLDVDISAHMRQGADHEKDDPFAVVLRETAQQLGVRFVSAKAPLEVLVVDRAERPSAN